jgi:hypothetical protein
MRALVIGLAALGVWQASICGPIERLYRLGQWHRARQYTS